MLSMLSQEREDNSPNLTLLPQKGLDGEDIYLEKRDGMFILHIPSNTQSPFEFSNSETMTAFLTLIGG